MFSLIISIIAIALVVALAASTLYYGGDAFSQGSARATASKFINQGQQINAAHTLFKNDEGGTTVSTASTLSPLADNDYLASIPTPATGVSWLVVDAGSMTDGDTAVAATPELLVVAEDSVSQAVCDEIVAQAEGATGVFNCISHEADGYMGGGVDDTDEANNQYSVVYAL